MSATPPRATVPQISTLPFIFVVRLLVLVHITTKDKNFRKTHEVENTYDSLTERDDMEEDTNKHKLSDPSVQIVELLIAFANKQANQRVLASQGDRDRDLGHGNPSSAFSIGDRVTIQQDTDRN